MNADRLLTFYERIADAPDAIVRFRRFILDLAVRGKLVKQDPNDEPAVELLKRIAAEKTRLVRAGQIRKQKAFPFLESPPFYVPENWRWARIREVTSDRGQKVPDAVFTYIDVTAIDKENGLIIGPRVLAPSEAPSRARKIIQRGDVIYSCVRPYLLNIAVIEDDYDPAPIASTAFAILNGHGFVLPRYLWITLRSPFMVACVEENQRGQAYPAINDADFAVLPLPLPPLAEQHRIVAKVDELMALCDRLEVARAEREATRDRLATASLARLNAPDPDPDTFRNHAAFAFENLVPLTTRIDQIKALRQTILNLAVRGKLVEQDPNDEPASELLQRIEEEKWDCTNHDRRRNDESDPSSSATPTVSIPLPPNWTWARLKDLIVAGPQNGLSPRPSEREDAPRALTLTATTSGVFDRSHFKRVEAEIGPDSEFWLQPNDLLFQRGNTREYVGMAAIYDGPPGEFIFPDLMMRVRLSPEINLNFIHLVCISPSARSYFSQNATGAQKTMPKINQIILRALPIPIPPLAEQHRIVATVEELMTLCDRLEGGLGAADTTRHRLFESLIQEALEPAANELETAR